MVSANYINHCGLYAVYAPIREFPATFIYCCPVTVLEWNSGHDTVPASVAKLESLISHCSHTSGYE
jgi:hypothetical protein